MLRADGTQPYREGLSMEGIKEPDIPVEWILNKYIRSRRYTGTITETGAKVILRDWLEYCGRGREESKKDDR